MNAARMWYNTTPTTAVYAQAHLKERKKERSNGKRQNSEKSIYKSVRETTKVAELGKLNDTERKGNKCGQVTWHRKRENYNSRETAVKKPEIKGEEEE